MDKKASKSIISLTVLFAIIWNNFAATRKQSSKSKKDSDKPKRGKSSFIYFLEDKIEAYKKKFPNLTHKETVSAVSENWHKLPQEAKSKYFELAAKDKERFRKENEAYKKKSLISKESNKENENLQFAQVLNNSEPQELDPSFLDIFDFDSPCKKVKSN